MRLAKLMPEKIEKSRLEGKDQYEQWEGKQTIEINLRTNCKLLEICLNWAMLQTKDILKSDSC